MKRINLREVLKIQNKEITKKLLYGPRKIDAYNDFSLIAPAYYDTLISSLSIDECQIFVKHNLSKSKRQMLLNNISDDVLQRMIRNKIIRLSEVSEERLKKYLLNDSEKRSLFFPLIWENCNSSEKYNLIKFVFSEPGLEEFSNIVLFYGRNHQLLLEFLTELNKLEGDEATQYLISGICDGLHTAQIVWQFFDKKIENRKIVKQFLEVLKKQDKLVAAFKAENSVENKINFLCDFDFYVLKTLKEKFDVTQELDSEEIAELFLAVFSKKVKLPEVFTTTQIRDYYLSLELKSVKFDFLKRILKEFDTMQCKDFFEYLKKSEKLQAMELSLEMSETICIKQMIAIIGEPTNQIEELALKQFKEKIGKMLKDYHKFAEV